MPKKISEDMCRPFMKDGNVFGIEAKDGDTVVGKTEVDIMGDHGYFRDLWVHPEWRGGGGGLLVDLTELEAKRQGLTTMGGDPRAYELDGSTKKLFAARNERLAKLYREKGYQDRAPDDEYLASNQGWLVKRL